jgi:hypothetical protein
MLIGLALLMIEDQQGVLQYFLDQIWSLRVRGSKPLYPGRVQRQSIRQLRMPLLKSCGFKFC